MPSQRAWLSHGWSFLLAFFTLLTAFAQTSDLAQDSLPQPADPALYERVMVRLDLSSLIGWRDRSTAGTTFRLGLEHHITEQLGWLWEVSSALQLRNGEYFSPNLNVERSGLTLQLTPRYYFSEGLDLGTQFDDASFSTNYLALQMATTLMALPQLGQPMVSRMYTDNFSFVPMVGLQRRLWTFAYVDLAVGVRMSYLQPGAMSVNPQSLPDGWSWAPAANLQLGLGLGN